jgi:3-oxoacyl-[acyl-carrier-protein] synthase II
MREATDQAVWITGLGLATPMGCTFQGFADQLLAGKSGIRAITAFDTTNHACKIGGFLEPLDPPPGWDRQTFQNYTLWQKLLVSCAVQALADAGWWPLQSETRIGLVLGLGGEWLVSWENDMHQGGNRLREPHTDDEGHTRFLRDQLQLQGPVSTVSAACASGNLALGMARQWIRRGRVDVVLAGAAECAITPMSVGCFGNLGALSKRNDQPAAASRPFDLQRDGFVMAEGGALFVLESARSARRRGAKVYGEVAGFGAASDAFHLVAPGDDPRYAAQAIGSALRDARLCPDDIDYVNAHATSTPVGDAFETKVLHQALGAAVATVPVSGTKSMTGHMVGAASAVEAAVCLAAFDRQAIPPTINLDEPDPECRLCHVANQSQSRRVSVALSNSFGFGGSNTCLILRQVA